MRRAMALLVVSLVPACGPATPTPAGALLVGPRPTVVVATPVGVPIGRAVLTSPFTPTPAPDYQSPGLGLSRADWGKRNGQTTEHFGVLAGTATVTVVYLDDRVAEISRDGKPYTFDDARTETRLHFLPPDTVYLRTDRAADGAVVDRFRSPSLAGLFPSARWTEPGTFAAVYQLDAMNNVRTYRLVLGQP